MANDQIQFFTGIPEYNQQFQISNVNAITHMIANCKQIKIPTYNMWHRKEFWQNKNDNGDKFLWWFEKRDWVTTIHWEQELSQITWFWNPYITHRIVLNWVAYYYVVNWNDQEMCVVAECWWAYRHDDCSLRIETIKNTVLKRVTTPKPYNQCVHNRFIKSRWPRKKKQWWCSWRISRVQIWNSYIYVFHWTSPWYVAQWSIWCFSNVEVWDILHIKSNSSTWLSWFFRPVSWFYTDEANWIYDWIQLDWDASLWSIEQDVSVELYEDVGNTISFGTADWVRQLHEDACDWVTNSETKYEMTWWTIDALFTFNGRMWYIADSVYHIAEWGYNYWTFIASNNIPLIDEYRDWVQVWNLLYLLWPTSLGIVAEYIFRDANWANTTLQRMYDVPESDWYFNKFSYDVKNWDFYMITNEWRWWWVTIMAAQSSTWSPIVNFSYKFLDLWKRHVNTDLAMLNRVAWDRVIVSSDERRVYLSILNWRPNDENNFRTHIMVYEFEDKYRHHWYFCHHYIEQFRNWAWIWPHAYVMEWKTDDWFSIKQVINYQFWDISPFSLKSILKLYHLFWGKTSIGKDTEMILQIDLHWTALRRRFVNLNSIDYLNIVKARWTAINEPIRDMWMRQKLFTWNWFSSPDFKLPSVVQDFQSYCWYENNKPFEPVNRCKTDITKVQDWCEDLRTNEPINDNDPRERTYFYNSKTSIHWFEISQFANLMSVELIADWEDNIEFFWYNIAYHFADMSVLPQWSMYKFPER